MLEKVGRAVNTYIFESALSKLKDENQTERILSFSHGSRKKFYSDKKFLVEPYTFLLLQPRMKYYGL